MRTAFLSVIALAICCVAAPTASASIFSNFLTFDGPRHTPAGVPFQGGGEDKLQDDSLTAFFDNGDGALGVGDIFVGVITLSEINSSGRLSMDVGAHEQIAIVTSSTITGVGSVAGSWAFGPTAAANANSLMSLFGAVPGVAGNISPNSIALMFSTSMNDDSANANDPSGSNDPLNWTYSFLSGNFGVAGAGGWSWEMTGGLTPGTSDFAEFLPTLPFGVGGTQRAGVTIEATVFPTPNGWLPVDVLNFAGTKSLHDFTLDTATFDPASGSRANQRLVFSRPRQLFRQSRSP